MGGNKGDIFFPQKRGGGGTLGIQHMENIAFRRAKREDSGSSVFDSVSICDRKCGLLVEFHCGLLEES